VVVLLKFDEWLGFKFQFLIKINMESRAWWLSRKKLYYYNDANKSAHRRRSSGLGKQTTRIFDFKDNPALLKWIVQRHWFWCTGISSAFKFLNQKGLLGSGSWMTHVHVALLRDEKVMNRIMHSRKSIIQSDRTMKSRQLGQHSIIMYK